MLKLSRGVVAVTVLVVLAACGTTPAPPPSESRASPTASPVSPTPSAAPVSPTPSASPASSRSASPTPPEHVVVAIFENKADSQVTASTAPYLTALIARSAVFVNASAITHPSQPNY